ncbi:oligopeptide transport system ATP-binding protein [Desulfotomaculum arcticum]|uniref:Oligopeptide transport system ATP-binding protein n=1 Tax=Desulfotruncus arcticus DSM 17038 TaxID=1121424 RepID=A0A1I2TSG7_9FIRM|nr:ABC transporter ATP-binding protein [Desulfotruncus arcticus]SFG65406.1 oligopeptide transport system ATP-binding protein [Desulfotomaculum arcticum] [Desulfotruncus arcticus DSM 17038]
MSPQLLEVNNLKTHFFTRAGVVKAVNGVSFSLDARETLGIVGESGSGKTITAMSIMRLVPSPPGKIVEGKILYKGSDIVSMRESAMREIRGDQISMIFQDPMTSLNPVLTIGYQIAEVLIMHRKINKKEALARAVEMLKQVGIPEPEKRAACYPHQLSGGMRQRAMIAMALACNPSLLIADEPTTALDVTIQAQILNLMQKLQDSTGTAIIMITHDLGVVAELCQKVLVMYAGEPVEQGDVETIFNTPCHPYTRGLLSSLPELETDDKIRLTPIDGVPPDLKNLPPGCSFASRCREVRDICRQTGPTPMEIKPGHTVACHCYN